MVLQLQLERCRPVWCSQLMHEAARHEVDGEAPPENFWGKDGPVEPRGCHSRAESRPGEHPPPLRGWPDLQQPGWQGLVVFSLT